MQSNLQYIYENTPRGRYINQNGSIAPQSMLIMCGRMPFPKSKNDAVLNKQVNFGTRFHPSCMPNVTTGVVSPEKREIFVVVNGPRGQLLPTADGFDIKIAVKNDGNKKWKIAKPFNVYWQATGYIA